MLFLFFSFYLCFFLFSSCYFYGWCYLHFNLNCFSQSFFRFCFFYIKILKYPWDNISHSSFSFNFLLYFSIISFLLLYLPPSPHADLTNTLLSILTYPDLPLLYAALYSSTLHYFTLLFSTPLFSPLSVLRFDQNWSISFPWLARWIYWIPFLR